MAVGDKVYGSDYNAVQLIIKNVLGTGGNYGGGSYGYGRTDLITSGTVAEGDLITETQWNALATDINVAYTHQNNTSFPGFASITGSITWANYLLLNTYAGNCLSNRLTANVGQLVKDSVLATATASFTWSTQVQAFGTVNFTDAAQCRYFFNQGGTINFEGFGPSLSGSVQDSKWKDVMDIFGYNIGYTEYQTLLTSEDPVNSVVFYMDHTTTPSIFQSPYTANYLKLLAWKPTTSSIAWHVIYSDGHQAVGSGPDTVSSGIGMKVYRTRATGAFIGVQPTATVTTNFYIF